MENILGILLLATLIEGLITYVFGESSDSTVSRPWLRYVSLALGIGACVAYKIDIPGMVGLVSAWPIVGYVVSGLIVGRGANYVNDIVALVRGGAR